MTQIQGYTRACSKKSGYRLDYFGWVANNPEVQIIEMHGHGECLLCNTRRLVMD